MRTAILVDGGFYRKRASYLWGKKDPENRAKELMAYCNAHLKSLQKFDNTSLYRIFYYDCPPLDKTVYHPLLQRGIDFRHSDTYSWTNSFFKELTKCRKVPLDQILLIAGDSDFVPAAKLARREGIDFILDPMWATIKDNLFEHIDGLYSQWGKKS